LRSEAGGQTDLEETNVDVTVNRAYKNNAHWLPQGQNSNFVAYYDAASLYPTSIQNPIPPSFSFPLLPSPFFFANQPAAGKAGGRVELRCD